MFFAGNACSIIFGSTISSISSLLWQTIISLWPWYWFWILVALLVWIIWEIITRNGTAHYNSKNGFSPAFNRFVGSGSYLGLQTLLFLLLDKLFGEIVYCFIWPYPVHAAVLFLTGLSLHLSGFWPYFKEPGRRRYSRR